MPFTDTSPEPAAGAGACRNCGTALTGPFCARCGQKDRPLNPSVRELARDAVADAFDLDGRLLRSLRSLFTRPGFLTAEIFAGRRAAYVSPFRLYLLFSVLAFAATAFTADRALMSPDGNVMYLGMGQSIWFDGTETPEERAAEIERARRLVARRTAWVPRIAFVMVPIVALVVMAVTRRTRRRYPLHLYFAFHLLAVFFAIMAAQALLPPVVPTPTGTNSFRMWDTSWQSLARDGLGLAGVVYAVMAFRRAYGGGWWLNIGRTASLVALQAAFFVGLQIAFMMGLLQWLLR